MTTLLLLIVLAQGVTDESILIGMEGPANSFSVDEENLGMHLVIRHANANGGIHGRKLVAVTRSRGTEDPVSQGVANARLLVEEDDVLTYLSAERGIKKIAVVHAPNIYGDYFAGRAEALADELGYAFVGAEALPTRATSARDEMARLQALDPDVVIMALYPEGARKAVEAKAALDWNVQLVSSGPLTDEQYFNVPGGQAEGTLGFCHYPDPNISDGPGVVTYRKLMTEHFPGHPMNRYSLYGYVFGSLVVEGLERAGSALTRDAFLDAMESIRSWDSGGILPPVSFSVTDHHAQDAGFICELEDGRFKPLSDWLVP